MLSPVTALGLLLRVVRSHALGPRWKLVTGCVSEIRRYWWERNQLNQNQIIAVTGCDSGLGYSLAVHCQNNGARVMAGVLQVDGPAANDLARRGVSVMHLDLRDNDSIRNFVEALSRMLEDDRLELRALVNNAGVMIFGEFEWQLLEQSKLQMEVNLLGTISMTREIMPLIRKYSSRIINVTSHCGLEPLPGLAVYSATKAALQAWTTSLRCELNKYGITVVSFIPGSFVTESGILANQKMYFEDMRQDMSEDSRRFYGDYFERYVEYLTSLPTEFKLCRIDNPEVYKAFDGALLDKYPSAFYKCEPWRYTFYHSLFRTMPTHVRDWLVQRFMRMPKWSGSDRFSSVCQDNNAKRL